MSYEVEPIVINTDNATAASTSAGLWENRAGVFRVYDVLEIPKCSIAVLAYNNLVKTKRCVKYILEYTQDIDYELILIDNGSNDGTFDFFQSVKYEKKKIVKITKNIGGMFGLLSAREVFSAKYLVLMPNDIYVTKNWLSNLLKCYESDPKIGFVVPVSSNVSNLQQVDLGHKDFKDMQKKAAAFNISNSAKWEERMRLLNVVSIFSRPVLSIVGMSDAGFVHDFSEDDFTARIRRAGYKLMLCRDTWVCHDHDYGERDMDVLNKRLDNGRKAYLEKFHGIDPWDDIVNFETLLLSHLDTIPTKNRSAKTLCINPRCGTPVLEVRNKLFKMGYNRILSYAFVTQAKYYTDLNTVADNVICDRISYIQESYANNTFDIIVCCDAINLFPKPVTLLQQIYDFLKPGGVLVFKLRNTDGFNAMFRTVGIKAGFDAEMPAVIPLSEITACLNLFGGINVTVTGEIENVSDSDRTALKKLQKAMNPNASNEDLTRLLLKDYFVKVEKPL